MDEVLAALPEHAEIEAWTKTLGDLEAKIRRLEPVNLAAIQEFNEQSQRKAYLDRSEEHTSETPVTNAHLVCRLLLEQKNRNKYNKVNQHQHEKENTTRI